MARDQEFQQLHWGLGPKGRKDGQRVPLALLQDPLCGYNRDQIFGARMGLRKGWVSLLREAPAGIKIVIRGWI